MPAPARRFTSRTGLGLGLIVAVLAAVFLLRTPASTPLPPTPTVAADVPRPPKIFDIAVTGGRLSAGPAVLSVTEGDEVRIRIVSDANEQLHLHGYDRTVNLVANAAAELAFIADKTGRFPYELEHTQRQLGVVEVHPR